MTKLERLLKVYYKAQGNNDFDYDYACFKIAAWVAHLCENGSINPAEIKDKKGK
jgi:hypothetical protein